MKKIILLLLGLFAGNFSRAQTSFGQYLASLPCNGGDSSAQSLYWSGGIIDSISLSIFSRYQDTDHNATLIVFDGEGINGSVLHTQSITVKGMNKFHSESMLDTMSVYEIEMLWVYLQQEIDSGYKSFNDLKTTFTIGKNFTAGQITILVILDQSTSNAGYRSTTVFTNCFASTCGPQVLDPYTGGILYWGYNGYFSCLNTPDADMAFKVFYTSTLGIEELFVPSADGLVYVPNSWAGAELAVYNLLGQTVWRPNPLFGGEILQLPIKQPLVFRLVSKGKVKTGKAILW